MKNSIAFLLALCLPIPLLATHMVGGEINYRCLGNDQYEISVTVFRDCDTGVPWFDNPASVGVFDANNDLVYDLRLTLRNNDTLELNLTDPCLVAPPNVCIHTTTYIDTVTLPFLAGGYQIVYQRCCRNQDIVNIVNPTATGATYSSFISEEALLGCNSSARFVSWPPVYVCAGVPFNYNHSAFDVDGDSIVYELCAPYTGATTGNPMPQPPFNPPYNPVTWLPPYNYNNMLGGPDSFRINSSTGLILGTPDNLGVFVVGVCANEYRNGVLISTTRRDFQYVVGICGELVSSAFFAPNIQCDNSFIVSFQNQSTTLGTGYIWTFGDSTTNATSNNPSPTYIYPDTGRYIVTLIADPNTLCSDTSVQEIYLQYESISIDFDVTTANCTDSFFLDITDLTIDSISTITQWDWNFGNGQTANIPYPSTVYSSSGTYIITLEVEAANGCVADYSDTLILDLPTVFGADTVGICPGETSIVLNPGGNPSHVYTWFPGTDLSSTTAASPIATPTGTTTYYVTVVVPNGVDTCVLERSITVVFSPPVTLDVIPDTSTCLTYILITATSNASLIEWSLDPNFSVIEYIGATVPLPATSPIMRYYVRATNAYGCTAIDSIDILKNTTPITVNWTYSISNCDPYTVQFTDQTTDLSGGAITNWEWQFGDGTISNLQNPSHVYAQTGFYPVYLQVLTENGCVGGFGDFLYILKPEITSNDTVGICPGNSSVVLNPNGNVSLSYLWSPGATLSDSTAVSPVASPLLPTTYTVTITSINGNDTCVVVEQVHVLFSPPVSVSVPPSTIYCGNTVTLTATSTTAVSYEWSTAANFIPVFSTNNPVTVFPTTFPFAGYYVRATDAYGCTATDFALIQQNQTPVNVNFSYQSLGCSNSMTIQFTDLTNDTLTSPIASWLWTTSTGQTSTLQNPTLVFTQSQPTSVTLEVTLANGCTGTFTQILNLNIASLSHASTIVLCAGTTSIKLNQGGNPNLIYQWSPGAFLSSTTDPEPTAFPPSLPFTYTVTITGYGSIDTCVSVQTVTLEQAPPITIDLAADTVICSGLYYLQASVVNAVQTDWAFNPFFSPVAISNINSFYIGLPPAPYTFFMYIRATDMYGCVKMDTIRISRQNIPIPVSFTPIINTCDDTLDVTFNNNTVMPPNMQVQSYNWIFGNGTTASSFNGFAQYTSNGNNIISLTVTSTNGCTGTYLDTLNYILPIINSRDTIGLCELDSIQLNPGGNPSLIYQWAPATGLSSTTAPSPIASPTSDITYTVTVTAPNGLDTCTNIRNITIGADSFLFEVMDDTIICFNQIALYVNSPNLSMIEWALDRTFNLVIGNSNPLITNVNDARWFYVRGRSIFGCEAMDSVLVQYRGNDIPVDFIMSPLNCGDSLVVSFQEISGDTTINTWNWDFGNGQSSTLQNPTTTYHVDSTYTIDLQIQIVGNCNGQTSKQLIAQIPVLDIPNANLVTCGNDSVLLNIQTNPNLTYEWSPSIGLSNPNTANPTALPPITTTYNIRVYGYSNFDGVIDTCWLEDSITVWVQPTPIVQVQGDSTFCDSVVNLSASSAQANIFEWSLSNDFQNIISNNSTLQSSIPIGQQWYYVQIRDSLGCENMDSTLVQNYQVDVNLPSNPTLCQGQNLQIIANTSSLDTLTYLWSPNSIIQTGQGTNTITTQPNTTTTINVLIENQYGCQDSAQTTVGIAPPLNLQVQGDTADCDTVANLLASSTQATLFEWSLSSDFQNVITNGSNLQITQLVGQQWYYVRVQDSLGCESIDSTLANNYTVDVNLPLNPTLCQGQNLQIIANSSSLDSLTYLWSPSGIIQTGQGTNTITTQPNTTTIINVLIENQYGCQDSAQTTVSIAPPLDLTVPNDTNLCTPTLLITASSSQPIAQYTWSSNSNFTNILGQNAALLTNAPASQTLYFVQIQDSFGCTKMDSVLINYNPADILLNPANIYCILNPVQLTAINLNAQDSLTYQWSPATDILSGQGTDTVWVAPNTTSSYTLTAINQYNCGATLQTTVSVLTTNPPLSITASQDSVNAGEQVQLIATQAGYTYTWAPNPTLFGDTLFNPLVTPDSTTTYYLRITDTFGCTADDSITIFIYGPLCDEPNIFVPNAFSPDGDGHNDIIYVEGASITDVYFIIYNRWGEKVFESNDKSIGWNGIFKGKACPPDVYGYYMKCKCDDGNEFSKKGNITLLR